MKTPNRPGSRKAQRKVKASNLMNIREKGCEPWKAIPRKKSKDWRHIIKSFVDKIPIGGTAPIGPRSTNWQDIGTNYITGLIFPGTRKSMEHITKRISDEDYQRMQQFITDSPWDSKATVDGLITFLRRKIASPEGVIIIDDTGSKKKGEISPGVAVQYFSETRKTGSCQRIVTCVYSEQIGPVNADVITWPLGMQLMLPKKWNRDKYRREKAGIPPDLRHKKNWMVALDLIENVNNLKVPHKCIIADTDYGRVRKFREQLQKWKMPYIMSVRLDKLNVISEDTPIIRPEDVVNKRGRKRKKNYLPKGIKTKNPGKMAKRTKDWTLIRWGEGAKGPLEAYFNRMRVRTVQWKYPSDEVGWLLLENGSEGVKAYICWGLDELTLKELVKLAHSRWAIEEYHKHIKNELGFDNFEGRKYRGWLHHSVLTQMAYAILQWMRWKHRGSDNSVSLPTLPKIRKIMISILFERLQPDGGTNGLCRTCPIVTMICEAG